MVSLLLVIVLIKDLLYVEVKKKKKEIYFVIFIIFFNLRLVNLIMIFFLMKGVVLLKGKNKLCILFVSCI